MLDLLPKILLFENKEAMAKGFRGDTQEPFWSMDKVLFV